MLLKCLDAGNFGTSALTGQTWPAIENFLVQMLCFVFTQPKQTQAYKAQAQRM